MWSANNCLQIMVCSYAMSSNRDWLQIIFYLWVNKIMLFSFLRPLLRENGWSLRFPKIIITKQTRWSNDKTDYWTRLSQNIVTCRLRQIIDLLASNKSRYFAQPLPIIVNHLWVIHQLNKSVLSHILPVTGKEWFARGTRKPQTWKWEVAVRAWRHEAGAWHLFQ